MASSKKLNHKVELKLVNEKKRRKSDLVIMWQSIWSLVLQFTLRARLTLLETWEFLKLWLWHDEFVEVRAFLRQYLPLVPDDLTHSWRDGKLLCLLLNKLHPGCIPDAEVLNPNYALRNMYHAFDILENTFGIIPNAFAEELVVCVEGSNFKLLEILSQLQKEFENNQTIPKIITPNETQEEEDNNSTLKNCVAKGTGLMLAFEGRAANFIIFCSSVTNLNLVLEIKGPHNTICRERITKRSPKKKQSTIQLPRNNPQCLSRSKSHAENIYSEENKEGSEIEKNLIPLEYDIYMNQISVTYTPLIEGQHIISILWHGEHVSDSPYVVQVESSAEINNMHTPRGTKPLKILSENESSDCSKPTVKLQSPMDKIERIGRVIKRRVLRHIVKIKGNDIVVDSSDINHLAVALLKMDYNFQTDPSKTRRNSWGFAGDAERKLSVIRQFCVPPDEMEAQQMKLQRRSRSLTVNTNVVPPLRKSTSFETEDIQQSPRLETVTEGRINCSTICSYKEEDEDAFAELDEEFQAAKETLSGKETEDLSNDMLASNSLEAKDKCIEDVNQFSIIPLNSNDEMLQTLLDFDLEHIESNDLNADSQENLSPESLTSSQDISVRQIIEDKPILFESSEFIKNKSDNFSAKLNLNFEGSEVLDGVNIKSENTCCGSIDDIHVSETNVLSNNIKSLPGINYEKDIVNPIVHYPCLIEKYPNLVKYLDELCKNLHYKEAKVEKESCSCLETKFKSCYSCKKYANKIRYPTTMKYACKYNCWLNNQEHERNKRYKYRKYRKYRTKTHSKKPNEMFYNASQNNSSSLCLKKVNEKERKVKLSHYTNRSYNSKELNTKSINDIDQNVPSVRLIELNFSEQIDKANNTRKKLLNSNKIDANYFKNKEKNNSHILPSKSNKNMDSSIKYSSNSSPEEPSTSGSNLSTESVSQKLLQLTSSHPETNSFHIEEHNLVSLGQFNFKQFSLTNERNKGNLIKNKIIKLENAIMRDSYKVTSKLKSERTSLTELVDIKAKLNFWENTCQSKIRAHSDSQEDNPLTMPLNYDKELKNQNLCPEKTETTDFKRKSRREEFSLSDGDIIDYHSDEYSMTDKYSFDGQTGDNIGTSENINHETPSKKISELIQDPKTKRSFSDPVVIDKLNRENFSASQNNLIYPITHNNVSSTDNLSSSIDADYWETSIDDDSDVVASSDDEYIDDEIPDSTLSTYWGDISLMKRSKMESMSSYEEYCQYIDSEVLKNQYFSVENCPSECKVFGIGNYFGYVAVKNRFHVLTKGADHGNLSASVQGFGKHDVSFVSVRYKQKDIYEITYQVMRPGFYLISLRWMENPILGSPFLCKITF